MDIKDLYNYRMSPDELDMWMQVVESVRQYSKQIEIMEDYGVMITSAISSSVFCDHSSGYCKEVGYYYIEEGDRGKIFLKCHTQNKDEICFYIMHQKILRQIGLKLEMEKRDELEKGWNGNNRYDSRKYWFEYVISNLFKVFRGELVEQIVTQYTGYMNRWFYDEHWKFNCELMEFVEISDSKEHD